MSDVLKPLSESVKRNWELWCEASYTKRTRARRTDDFVAGPHVSLGFGFIIAVMVGLFAEAWGPPLMVMGMGIVVAIWVLIYYKRKYAKVELIPERLEQLRLADVRALRLYELYLYMIELQKKLLEQSRMDAAYRISGQELPLREHLDRFAAQMETLETSFCDHGDLGTLLEIAQIEQVGTKAIVQAQLTERDTDARRRAVHEVERTMGLKS